MTFFLKKNHAPFSQGDWPDGYRLATAIQFRFPECQKVDLPSLIPRASEPGLQLLDEFLQWDSDKRPSAQQALKYTFFQITKRGSDPIHMPSSLLAKHQQHNHGRGFEDHVSHVSLDDVEKYKDHPVSFRKFEQFNSHRQPTNGVKQPLMNGNHPNLTDADRSPKRTKPENGIKTSIFNGDYNNSSLNNNYQSEVSADDAVSEEMMRKYPFATNTSDTGFSSTITTRNSQNSSTIAQTNYQNDASIALNGTKTVYGKGNEHKDGVNSRRNSRIIDQNPLMNEKISDIYVNRNLGKLYDNTIRGSIYNNKLYNNELNEDTGTRPQEFSYKNQTFFLHDNNSTHFNENHRESKIYNIFSKQRLAKPRKFEQPNDIDDDEDDENAYLQMKMQNAAQKQPKKSISIMRERRDSFEDEELDRLLG